MAATTTVFVPHLDTQAGFRLSNGRVDPAKPTVVMINSMCTTAALFEPQFSSARLTDAVNLLAIEPLGHGATRSRASEHFTYWDSALVALQVMESLGVDKAYALGTSQGGWIVTRMALLKPDKVCCVCVMLVVMVVLFMWIGDHGKGYLRGWRKDVVGCVLFADQVMTAAYLDPWSLAPWHIDGWRVCRFSH